MEHPDLALIVLSEQLLSNIRTEKAQEEFYDSSFVTGGSFGVRVSKSGRKAFFLIYNLHGRRKRLTLGLYPVLSLANARSLAVDTLEAVLAGRDPAAESKRLKTSENFQQFSERFLLIEQKRGLSASTLREYRRIIERELLPVWAERRPGDITEQDVRALLGLLSVDRNKPVMANRCRTVIRRIFEISCELGVSKFNPTDSIPRIVEDSSPRPTLSLSSLRSLWSELINCDSVHSAIFQTLLLTAQRPRDVCELQWSDMRMDVWTVRTSSNEHRCVLPDALLPTFHRLRGLSESSDYVFLSSRGGVVRYLRRASRRYLLSEPWGPSDIRRSMRELLPEMGVRPDVIQALMGTGSAIKMAELPGAYDYLPDVREAQELWVKRITASPTPPKGRRRKKRHVGEGTAKVIPLFGDLEI